MRVQGLSSPQARIFVLHAAGFPPRISCSSNKHCFDSSVAACRELLPMQRVSLCVCKGACKVAALILPYPLFYLIFQDKKGGGKERANKPSLTFLLPPETLQFTGAVRWSWVSSCQQLGVNSSPSYPLQKWALADWTNISYLPASPPSWIILGLIHHATSSAQPRDIDT